MQEAIDRLVVLKQKDNQIDQLQIENGRLQNFEANFEDVQVNWRDSHICCDSFSIWNHSAMKQETQIETKLTRTEWRVQK